MNTTHYLVRSTLNAKMIYCTDGDFHYEMHCGPGMYSARLYKTARGAKAVRSGDVTIHACDDRGVEAVAS